jgi:hypothetical protein
MRDLVSEQRRNADSDDDEVLARDVRSLEMAEFYASAGEHVRAVTPSSPPDEVSGFVLVYNVSHPVLSGLMVPLVRPLAERGYSVAAVTVGTLRLPP